MSFFHQVPLVFQISWIVLVALILWAFAIAHRPRQWRRFYQSIFGSADEFSVNRNKVLDESVRRYAVLAAMGVVVVFVVSFVLGLTYQERHAPSLTPEDEDRIIEQQRLGQGGAGRSGI